MSFALCKVIRRIQPDSDHELSVPQEVTYNIHNESDIIWRSKLVLAKNSAPIIDEQQLPQDDEYNVHNEARTLWNSDTILAERSASADADQQPPKPEIKMKLVGFSEVLALNAGDNKTRVTLQKDFAGNLSWDFFVQFMQANSSKKSHFGQQQYKYCSAPLTSS